MDNAPTARSIFRAETYARYVKSREAAVLPRFIRPRTFLLGWAIVALLVAGSIVAWNAEVPVFVPVAAFAVRAEPTQPDLELAVLVPAELRERIAVGSEVLVRAGDGSMPERARIERIDPRAASPADLRARFRDVLPVRVDAPMVVAFARISALERASGEGSSFRVDVHAADRRALALFPWIGRFFRDRAPAGATQQ